MYKTDIFNRWACISCIFQWLKHNMRSKSLNQKNLLKKNK